MISGCKNEESLQQMLSLKDVDYHYLDVVDCDSINDKEELAMVLPHHSNPFERGKGVFLDDCLFCFPSQGAPPFHDSGLRRGHRSAAHSEGTSSKTSAH